MSFDAVEDVLGRPLPEPARTHLAHWHGYDGTALGRAIRDAGWKATGGRPHRRTRRLRAGKLTQRGTTILDLVEPSPETTPTARSWTPTTPTATEYLRVHPA